MFDETGWTTTFFSDSDNRSQEQKKIEFRERKEIRPSKWGHICAQNFDSNTNLQSYSPEIN